MSGRGVGGRVASWRGESPRPRRRPRPGRQPGRQPRRLRRRRRRRRRRTRRPRRRHPRPAPGPARGRAGDRAADPAGRLPLLRAVVRSAGRSRPGGRGALRAVRDPHPPRRHPAHGPAPHRLRQLVLRLPGRADPAARRQPGRGRAPLLPRLASRRRRGVGAPDDRPERRRPPPHHDRAPPRLRRALARDRRQQGRARTRRGSASRARRARSRRS